MQHNTVDESIRLALQVCIEQNIMKEYLGMMHFVYGVKKNLLKASKKRALA